MGTMTFKAVYQNGQLKPLDATLDLGENESVWVSVTKEPRLRIVPTTWQETDAELSELRKKLAHLPSLEMDKAIAEDRERL